MPHLPLWIRSIFSNCSRLIPYLALSTLSLLASLASLSFGLGELGPLVAAFVAWGFFDRDEETGAKIVL